MNGLTKAVSSGSKVAGSLMDAFRGVKGAGGATKIAGKAEDVADGSKAAFTFKDKVKLGAAGILTGAGGVFGAYNKDTTGDDVRQRVNREFQHLGIYIFFLTGILIGAIYFLAG